MLKPKMNVTKKFSANLHEKHDSAAKHKAIAYFSKNYGLNLKENEDRFGPDLKAFNGEEFIGYVECEQKNNWDKDKFPFKDVQIPARKAKFLVEVAIIFFMLNKDGSKALHIDGVDVAESSTAEVPNVHVEKGEQFYKVSIDKAVFVDVI